MAWEQKPHAQDYLIYSQNISPHLSIDELSLSQGELYTFLTSKEGKGKQGTMVAMVAGTESKTIIEVLEKLPLSKRLEVKEITLDMAQNMEAAIRKGFPNAELVTDRFHVIKLIIEALQHLRTKKRWEVIEKENEAIKEAKRKGVKYKQEELANGDTLKQLLYRSRLLLYKMEENWTPSQKKRAAILFERYPDIETAYRYTIQFRAIYNNKEKEAAKKQFTQWINDIQKAEIKEFNTAANSIKHHLETILNFFNNKSTNANAESFNAKIKLFRANQRGVKDVNFFLYRLEKLFA
jgi:transposase